MIRFLYLLASTNEEGNFIVEASTMEIIQKESKIRKAAVAGLFYPKESDVLRREVEILLRKNTSTFVDQNPLALLLPHAGYSFSGDVAASGFSLLNPSKKIDTVFIIGTSHHHQFDYCALPGSSEFETPLGTIPVNRSIVDELNDGLHFQIDEEIHKNEHSLEVMLPFLQCRLEHDFTICPVLLGCENETLSTFFSVKLQKYFNDNNLFIFSTDLSHYPGYADAVKCDTSIIDAILKNNLPQFVSSKKIIEQSEIPNLQTALCGYSATYLLLKITQQKKVRFEKIKYANSGDASGEFGKVVGYASIGVFKLSEELQMANSFSELEKQVLHSLAMESLTLSISSRRIPIPDMNLIPDACKNHRGVFVSLYKNGELRGCIGTFRSDKPIAENVVEMTRQAALYDPRFHAVQQEEIDDISLSISVLTPMRKINSVSEIEPGLHGIYLKNGCRSATFLPHVAIDERWSREDMLNNCCLKAGLDINSWRESQTEIYIYEAQLI